MKCKLWTETLEFRRWKVPNSRFALHGLAPPQFTVCAPFLPLILTVYAPFSGCSWHPSRQPLLRHPLSSRFALHGLRALDHHIHRAISDTSRPQSQEVRKESPRALLSRGPKRPTRVRKESEDNQKRVKIMRFSLGLSSFLGPEAPRVAAVKKNLICCTMENVEDFSWNYLRPFSLEIEGRKSAKDFAKISPHFSPSSSKHFARTSLWGIAGTIFSDFWIAGARGRWQTVFDFGPEWSEMTLQLAGGGLAFLRHKMTSLRLFSTSGAVWPCKAKRGEEKTYNQEAADVWEKDVWEFQAKSGSSGSCCHFLYFLGKIAVQEMSGRTPGSPRHPSCRHPRPSDTKILRMQSRWCSGNIRGIFGHQVYVYALSS